jgi:hypothetical protein
MSETNYSYRFQINKILSKIDTILSQIIKTKRVANENNIIIKKVNKQIKYEFETIHHSVEGKMKNHEIPGSGTNVFDPANCVSPTVKLIGKIAGSSAMPGSGLGVTHGIVSDTVSNLIRESSKPRKSDELTHTLGSRI